VPAPAQLDPAPQAKGFRIMALSMVVGGVLIGVGMPLLFLNLQIEAYMTPWGFDIYWVICLAMMAIDFVLAWFFWRRADAAERTLMGLPPRP
jgi:Na+-driven multidrug efflux pump